jgi:DNA polymerase-1
VSTPPRTATETVLLVDGNSLIHRAFHATPPLTTSRGELVNAVYAFARMLFRALNTLKPGYVVVAFDRAAPTFRHVAFDAYKAHRAPGPEGLFEQFGRVHELVDVLSFQTCEVDGFEADDVLGTLASQAAAAGLTAVIVSGDTDALQLVNDQVQVLMPRKGMTDTVLYDRAAVVERYGLNPEQLIDFKALKGDPSDNIPGVPGIGEKTAARLLSRFGSIDGLLAHLDEVEPRLRQAIVQSADQLRQARELVTIVTNAPIQLDLAQARAGAYEPARLDGFLRELEFRIPPNELPPHRLPPTSAAQRSLFNATETALPATVAVPAVELAPSDAAVDDADYRVLTEAELPALVERLRHSSGFAVDVETTSTDPMRAELVGISLAERPGQAWYLPVGHRGEGQPSLTREAALTALGPVLADASVPKLGHNLKYDALVLNQAGAPVEGLAFDTMIARYLLQSTERALGLKDVAFFELGIKMTEISELIGKGKAQITMDQVPVDRAAPYACADADVTFRLVQRFTNQLRDAGLWDLFSRVEMPLLPVLGRMEQAGVAIDVNFLKAMSGELAERITALESQIHDLVGHPFNLNSTQQLGKVLFDELGLPTARKSASGGYSTDADTLEELRPRHPVVGLVLDYRQLVKLKSTYVDALPLMINPRTGRVHTSFNQTGAATGRLSSSDPNLQNIPIRTDLGKQVRRAFIAGPPGWQLLTCDYSQVELRILAHITQDANLLESFRLQRDIHAATASQILGVPLAQVTSDQRRMAKTVNFGVLYGMGDYGLATQLGLARAEARAFIQNYFARYPTVAAYLEDTKRQAKEQGFVTTLLGRRRYIPEINTPNRQVRAAAERVAINMPIQGTAADIIKVAMINIDAAMRARKLRSRMILQVHDELVFEAPQEEIPELRSLVVELMEGAFPMTVPLQVEARTGPNWQDLE